MSKVGMTDMQKVIDMLEPQRKEVLLPLPPAPPPPTFFPCRDFACHSIRFLSLPYLRLSSITHSISAYLPPLPCLPDTAHPTEENCCRDGCSSPSYLLYFPRFRPCLLPPTGVGAGEEADRTAEEGPVGGGEEETGEDQGTGKVSERSIDHVCSSHADFGVSNIYLSTTPMRSWKANNRLK